ncbi:MAG: LCP family protein [Chloroflexota bacterium]|nr:LCP family protein [Chloroflexota bacterium]
MRIPGWLMGIVGLLVLVLGTGLCSLTAFSLTRQTAIDLQEVGDPSLTLRCLVTGQWPCADNGSVDPSAQGSAPMLILTPLVTALPAADSQENEPPPVVTTPFNLADPATALPPTDALPEPDLPIITDPRQIRILLLGIDQRSAAGETGPFRTDTMILMSIDPVRKTVGVLSLLRDLWVTIPGYEANRLNTANFIGDRDAYPGGGGPALAMETVSTNFGLSVDKYILINFDVFTTIVDVLAPDGVPIRVRETINDPFYPDAGYGMIHVVFEPGEQRMNAERLLQYARTRATEGGDFDRARRQQQVLDAARAEVLSAGGIVNLVANAPELWSELSNNYRTNLELNDILALGQLMSQIKREDIRFEVVNNFYVNDGFSPSGESVLFPDYAAISELIQRTFYPHIQLSPAEIKARADAEAAPIYVYNGTQIFGLAGATREWLIAKGVLVTGVGNATSSDLERTEIRNYGGRHLWTARYIAQLLGLPDERIVRAGDGLIAEGVMLALGEDAPAIIEG